MSINQAQTKQLLKKGGTLSVLTIEGVGAAKTFRLELANRINLFTGDNGLGKSFILDCAWYALSGHWSNLPASPREDADEPQISFQTEKFLKGYALYDWKQQEWVSLGERPVIESLLIYARVDGAFAVWDPARELAKGDKPLIFTREEIWNGLQSKRGDKVTFLSNGLIADWIHWQNSPEKEPFETFRRVLKRLSPPELETGDIGILEPGKPTRISRDSRWMPTIKHAYGEIPLVYASAGVQRIVALAYLIVWAWEEHKAQSKLIRQSPKRKMVILVDEFEAHLHPQWQRKIITALLEVQEDLALSMQLLIATHSPLLMSSIEPIFDCNQDKIFHFDLLKYDSHGAEVVLQEPEFVIYGTVDSWLRSEIFELSQPRSFDAERAIEDAKKLQLKDAVTKAEVEDVSERLMKYLSAHDPFWSRWTFFATEHGVEL
jgi:energy-coupling factor transporter ATP-binding protein EcfA2